MPIKYIPSIGSLSICIWGIPCRTRSGFCGRMRKFASFLEGQIIEQQV